MWEWHGMGFGGGFMWILWLLIFLVIFKLLSSDKDSGGNTHHDSALEILEKRFASGEIDEMEFQHRKKELLR